MTKIQNLGLQSACGVLLTMENHSEDHFVSLHVFFFLLLCTSPQNNFEGTITTDVLRNAFFTPLNNLKIQRLVSNVTPKDSLHALA